MTWQTDMTLIIRSIINDLDSSNYTYTDSRIQQAIAVAAQLVQKEITFPNVYEVDLSVPSITPDPTLTTPRDDAFINLVSLKTVVVIYSGELRLGAKIGIKVVDGPSQIDATSMYKNLQELLNAVVAAYNKARVDYLLGNSIAGQVISTPITSPMSVSPFSYYDYRFGRY